MLAGGFPPGSVATLEGATGRWSVAAGLVAAMTRKGLVAILDDGALYPPISPKRVSASSEFSSFPFAKHSRLLARPNSAALADLPADSHASYRLRDSIWTRLATLAHRNGVLLIVMVRRAGAALSAAAELRLHCALERIIMRGTHGLWGSFAGFELCIGLRKHKHLLPGRQAHVRALSSMPSLSS